MKVMGLYIKGMSMPKDNCEAIKQITITNNWVDGKMKMLAHDSITNEFIEEVVEVPEPHGRLIDADECAVYREHYETYNDYSTAFDMIDNTPTVIEAGGGGRVNGQRRSHKIYGKLGKSHV